MSTTQIKAEDTRQPSLTRAVIRQTGRENLEDIACHGADGGFGGFTYYADTIVFTAKHKMQILARLRENCAELGCENVWQLLAGFNCLKGYTQDEIVAGFYESKSEHRTTVFNALAWYAAEEIARELNPDI